MIDDFSIKYRPNTLDGIIGNDSLVKQLTSMFVAKKFPKCSLLVAPFGSGKTTCAYIIKNNLECSDINFKKVLGDCGVDEVRSFIENIKLTPMGKSKTRILFIDEAHKLSNASTSTLLEETEGTKDNVYFILATNLPDKLDKALRSRCTVFKLKALSADTIAQKLLYPICVKENLDISKKVLTKIGECSDGCPRTALVTLNKIRFIDKAEHMENVERIADATDDVRAAINGLFYNSITEEKLLSTLSSIESDYESFRYQVMDKVGRVLIDVRTDVKVKQRAYQIGCCFHDSYTETGRAGLGMSIYELFHS